MESIAIKILCLVSLFKISLGEFLKDSPEKVKERFNWNVKHQSLITKDRVAFEYTEILGTHCRVKKDLFDKEFTFSIPNNFILCGCTAY